MRNQVYQNLPVLEIVELLVHVLQETVCLVEQAPNAIEAGEVGLLHTADNTLNLPCYIPSAVGHAANHLLLPIGTQHVEYFFHEIVLRYTLVATDKRSGKDV